MDGKGKDLSYAALTSFHAVVTPSMANFKLPTWNH